MNRSDGRLINVLFDELTTITPTRCCLPLSDNFHLQLAINKLHHNSGDTRGIEHFAKIACTSPRTVSGLFIKESGLSFSNWRKRLKLLTTIEMFRKEFVIPPGKHGNNIEPCTYRKI